jgi:hypothetical protein
MNYCSNSNDVDVITEDNNENIIERDEIKHKTGGSAKLETFIDKSETIKLDSIHEFDDRDFDTINEEQNEDDLDINKQSRCKYLYNNFNNIFNNLAIIVACPLSDEFEKGIKMNLKLKKMSFKINSTSNNQINEVDEQKDLVEIKEFSEKGSEDDVEEHNNI